MGFEELRTGKAAERTRWKNIIVAVLGSHA